MTFEELEAKTGYLAADDQALLAKAYNLANSAHQGQKRISGEPYVEHPLAVAGLLADLHLDIGTLAAALLHDTVEDTGVTTELLREEFGPAIAKLVEGVTKLGKIHVHSKEQAQAENIRKMLLAMAEDIRVVLIKLSDRLHNMRTVEVLPEPRRKRMAYETLDIYAPLAHRLGIWQFKNELEERAFAQLDPDNYLLIQAQLADQSKEYAAFIKDISEILERELEPLGIKAEIAARTKNTYSIHEKMQKGSKKLDEIYDVLAIRIVVPSVRDCYAVLGVAHSLWKPIPGRFKDYIAMPKGNGYQSLHTSVISHTGGPMEIQIRTKEMHETAEFGIAAHWRYKQGPKGGKKVNADQHFDGLHLLMDWQRDVTDAQKFVDAVKVDFFQDEVFVFTPKGDVRALPAGSTTVDFAYRIHTDVGHHCIGAKANGRMVPLDYKLENGDIVEILTTKAAHGPSRDWLNFVKTAGTREKIRGWFKKERREENVQKGRELLDKEFKRMRQMGLGNIKEERLLDFAKEFKYNNVDEFLAAIGYGEVNARSVLLKFTSAEEDNAKDDSLLSIPVSSAATIAPSGGVQVHGINNVLTTLAKCCKPVIGEPVVGYITRGKGVTVHLSTCSNVVNAADRNRLVDVSWDQEIGQVYPVGIKIEAWDRTGLLRDIAAAIAELKVNLNSADVQVNGDRTAIVSTVVEIPSLAQLSRLLERIESIKDVRAVTRDFS